MTKRDIGLEILNGIQTIKRGDGKTYQVPTEMDNRQVQKQLHSIAAKQPKLVLHTIRNG